MLWLCLSLFFHLLGAGICSTVGFVDFVDLYLFCATISYLYPPNFILLFCSMQHFVLYRQCYGSVYHCFSTYWALGLAQFTVDFVHNLYFQVRLVKYERHAVAHHTLYIQASGTNDTKSTTELSPVLIRILLRFQSLASTLDYSWGSLASPPVFKVKL